MDNNRFDVIVIGAGAMGSAATYHLAKDGKRVLLLEQFQIGHDRGSTHGESRIFRFAYPEMDYCRLSIQCKTLWQQLEADADQPLLTTIGGIDIGEGEIGLRSVQEVADSLQLNQQRYEIWTPQKLQRHYPQWHLPENARIVYSPDSGIINPITAVQVMTKMAGKYHATIHENETVLKIKANSSEVYLTTNKSEYIANKLILTVGGWATKILTEIGLQLPLQVSKEQTAYFKPKVAVENFYAERFKIFIHYRDDIVYGFPALASTGVAGIKIGFHHDNHFIDIDDYDQKPDQESIKRLSNYLQQYLPDAAGEFLFAVTCLYTNTPDNNFIVDLVPHHPHIAFATGFSGHGFKFATGIGRALADLVTIGKTDLHIPHLAINRYLS